ncbi:hypothetical protein GH5_07995 [Leishmania sp. Ghana 2012 LV757]|uniref:hypothetical protein n=1 Tax=Leishmania sp. Ghana 2012 LV757 TaxID=2803181 RepID=UPI001B6C0CA8|nr:hypothetical protein GH5_07995 [Leishmania sp. Ghana 2012 LV757]
MGKANLRRRHKASSKSRPRHHDDIAEVEVEDVADNVVLKATAQHHLSIPPCVQQLRESREYTVLEDACNDVAHFALQPRHNDAFLGEAVPQRLVQLLILPPYELTQPTTPPDAPPVVASSTSPAAATAREEPQPHKGILYMQISAAEALRSLVVNSEQDRVIDALTSAGVGVASGKSFAEGLACLVRADWQRVQQARRRMTPEDWMEVYHEGSEEEVGGGEAAGEGEAAPAAATTGRRRRQAGSTRNLYFTLLRHLEEVLVLASVCVEASEACAEALADEAALLLLLDILRVATTTTWETLLHPSAQYYADEAQVPVARETVLAMRAYKRREARLLASVAVGTADVLLLLSPESQSLAQVLTRSSGVNGATVSASSSSPPSAVGGSAAISAEQMAFLNTALDAVDLRAWLAEKPAVEVQLQERFSDAALPSFLGSQHTVLAMERERVLYDLLRATLAVQGMLLHVAPVAANLQRVLPLLNDTLHKVSLPMHVWRGVLPLLTRTCECADDDVRTAATTLTIHRLRCTQSAVRLLHVMVNAVGEKNDTERYEDDEAAFAANPLGALLQSGGLFYAFGLLLKDVLWMSPNSDAGGNAAAGVDSTDLVATHDVMTLQAQQRALRTKASANAAATEMQMVLLATEVNVWEVASTLLLMLPVASLGCPALTWRALMRAVLSRYELHLSAASAEALEEESRSAHANILQHSAGTHQLLWMQLESLGQMLWTMQRKQSNANGGSAALTACNHVQATSVDVDLLIRVSWEASASTLLKQSCVGTVGLLCASMQSAEAVATAARFALAVVANGGPAAASSGKKLLDVYTQLVPSKVPECPAERRVWLQQLALADAAATVRCEAANAVMDLFLDERYDSTVYWQLGVQDSLSIFKTQLAGYVKQRQQLDKAAKRSRHFSTETPEAEQWSEVLDNLCGFIDYKARHR